MKKLISLPFLVATVLFSSPSNASMHLFCQRAKTPTACAEAAEAALEKIGCSVDKQSTSCTYSRREDPNNPDATIPSTTPYCEISSDNCAQPRVGNFGGESCDAGLKTQLSKADGVNNGYWFGLLGSYSRTICRQP